MGGGRAGGVRQWRGHRRCGSRPSVAHALQRGGVAAVDGARDARGPQNRRQRCASSRRIQVGTPYDAVVFLPVHSLCTRQICVLHNIDIVDGRPLILVERQVAKWRGIHTNLTAAVSLSALPLFFLRSGRGRCLGTRSWKQAFNLVLD
jgi:hypothetical protein